jgi:branched-chain amino acid transport system permease protein
LVGGIAALWLLPLVGTLGRYEEGLLTQTFLFATIALAWNWLGGYVGQVSFGHAAMFGVGGFVAARVLAAGVPFLPALLVGGVAAGAYAVVWGHPTLRLRGPYFAIATIGVGEATRLIATYWRSFTGGATGTTLSVSAGTRDSLYWYGLVLMAGAVALSFYLRKGRIGFALIAIKDDVDAAEDVGVNATFYQDVVLLLSGAVVGLAGAIYAAHFSFIEPSDMLGFDRSIGFVMMCIIGGIGTVLGPILGASIFVVVQEFLVASYPQLYLGFYGLLLIAVVLFEPLGLVGLLSRLLRPLRSWGRAVERAELRPEAVTEAEIALGQGLEEARDL